MDDKEVSTPCLFISEEKTDRLYPMYFGVSCAFIALRLLSGPDLNDERWLGIRDKMLQGSAHLLGLLVWRVQKTEVDDERCELLRKLEIARREVAELKRRRSEDAKANEKVVGIFSVQEQSWLSERKQLRQQIGALINEIQVLEKKKEEAISDLNAQVQILEDKVLQLQSKDKALEEEESKSKELEEKLQKAETLVEELRETLKRAAQEHSSELWKHKSAFIELVSNQRHLESEMGRALRQVEITKQELESVFSEKEESISMVQKLSVEIIKMRKDSEQKDNILSAMLRKSKLDTTEKQMLLKEIKISNTRRKQVGLEMETQKAMSEYRRDKNSSWSNSAKPADSGLDGFSGTRRLHPVEAGCSNGQHTRLWKNDDGANTKTRLIEFLEAENKKERQDFAPQKTFSALYDGCDGYSSKGNGDLVTKADLESWVQSEAEKYATAIEHRHHLEIDAFAEQMRLKDQKLEAFHWQLLSMELETKRLQSHIEELNGDLSELRKENIKLEALLLDRDTELKSIKEKVSVRLNPLHYPKNSVNSSSRFPASDHKWSDVKVIKRKPREKEQAPTSQEPPKVTLVQIPEELEIEEKQVKPFEYQSKDVNLTIQTPENVIEVEELSTDPVHGQEEFVDELPTAPPCLVGKNSSPWKLDLLALGVTYKIKRLKQQLAMLERLAGKQETCEDFWSDGCGEPQTKGFASLMSLLNKQVCRYQSLQEKTDDLCKRMHENGLDVGGGYSKIAKTKDETKSLEHFLEETFQLQRYMVATGQKLMEIQSRMASGFSGTAEELNRSSDFDAKRFADGASTLFREVQRGLDIQIARIIGYLEGTLAYEGITHLSKTI